MPLPNILQTIVAHKRDEISALYQQFHLQALADEVRPGNYRLRHRIEQKQAAGQPFFITEFKRRSPSQADIGQAVDLEAQVGRYLKADTDAISVLTDAHFFGGSFDDLRAVVAQAHPQGVAVLMKDFVLDPLQVYLGRHLGADVILLIAAILTDDEILALHNLAQSLGMDTLLEVHTRQEAQRAARLGLPIVGINNRDLGTFGLALNTTAWLAQLLPAGTTIVSESGIETDLDLRIAGQWANGFLIGTSLMQRPPHQSLQAWYAQAQRYYLKACGIRHAEHILSGALQADLLGLNFSPTSRRRVSPQVLRDWLAQTTLPRHAAALFYQNSPDDQAAILQEFPFRYAQVYAPPPPNSYNPAEQRLLGAVRWMGDTSWPHVEALAPIVDAFILDGPMPGSGQSIGAPIPHDFPYPFFLAGGMTAQRAPEIRQYRQCIGIDAASALEDAAGQISPSLIAELANALAS